MAALTFFGVTGTFSAALKDSVYDVDTDPELAPMSGAVTFTPLIDSGDSIPAATLTPPSNLFLVPIKATIRSGVITSNGVAGVKLVANTAVLGLTGSLYYQVDFGDGLTAGGKTYSVRTFAFQAPTTAVTVDLVEVTPAVGQPATGPVPSSAVLSVAGRTGNIIITAADIVGVEDVANKNAANGYAGLDGNSKISLAAMPVGAMEYKGVWNASTNSPTLTDGTGTAGFLYRVGTAGTRNLGSGSVTWDVGDYVIHNGTAWEKSDATDAVASVAGRTGAVTLAKADVGLGSVDNTADTAKPVSTAQGTAISAAQAAAIAASQPLAAKLTTLAGQTWAADTLTYQTSASALSTTPFTAAGRALVDDADAAAQRTTLGVLPGLTPEQFGAVGNGSTNDLVALNACFAAAAGKTVWLDPSKTYAHNDVVTIGQDGTVVAGGGTLKATNAAAQKSAVIVTGDNVVLDHAQLTCPTASTRRSTLEDSKLALKQCDGAIVRNVTIDGSSNFGLLAYGATNFRIDKPVIKNTMADGLHVTHGSTHGVVTDPSTDTTGDDGIAVVSYVADGAVCEDIRINGFKVKDTSARGISVVGGTDIRYGDGDIDGTTSAPIYVSCEAGFSTYGVTRVIVDNVDVANGNSAAPTVDHGAVMVYNDRATGFDVDTVTITDIRVRDTDAGAAYQVNLLNQSSGNITGIELGPMTFTGTGPSAILNTVGLLGPADVGFNGDADYVDNITPISTQVKAIDYVAGGTAEYRLLANLPIDDSGNLCNLSLSGRLGGWTSDSFAQWQILLSNRSNALDGITVKSSVFGQGAIANAMSSVDIVVYAHVDKSASVYIKHPIGGFYAYDFDVRGLRATIVYDGVKSTSVPTGTLIWSLSSTPKMTMDTAGITTLPTPVLTGLPTGTGVASAATASTLAARDGNANLSADALIPGSTGITTAAGTTTLTIDSTQVQVCTGSTTQNVDLPTTSVLKGMSYTVINLSSGIVTVRSSAGNSLATMVAPASICTFTANQNTPTTSSHWERTGFATRTASQVFGTNSSGLPVQVSYGMTASANAVAQRDANANLLAGNHVSSASSISTAAGTTALTVSSNQVQIFTGATTQTVTLPTTSIAIGYSYKIINTSSGAVTVNSSGGNLVKTLAAGAQTEVTALATTPTTAAHWFAT